MPQPMRQSRSHPFSARNWWPLAGTKRAVLVATLAVALAWLTLSDSQMTAATVAQASASGVQLVQATTAGSESSVSNISVAFPSNTVAGDLLVVTGTAARPSGTLSIADTAGDTFSTAIGPVNDPAQDVDAYIWYVPAARGGANTVTLTPTSARALEIHVSEYSGAARAPLDTTSWATGNSTTASSGSATTLVDGELVFGYSFVAPSTSDPGSGFTGLSFVNGDWDEYAIQTKAGRTAATFGQPSGGWIALMATFAPASGSTNTPTPTNTPTSTSTSTTGPTSTPSPTNTTAPTSTTTPTPNASPVVALGQTTVQSNQDDDAAGMAEAFEYTATASASVTRLVVYLDGSNAAGSVAVGLYTNLAGDTPGSVLTRGSISTPIAGAWNSINVPPVGVSAGQRYWIAVLSPTGGQPVRYRDAASGGKSQTSSSATLAQLPDPWAPGATWANSPFSAYAVADGATAASPTPTNTSAPTNTPTPTTTPVPAASPTPTNTPAPTLTSTPTNTVVPSLTPTLTPTPTASAALLGMQSVQPNVDSDDAGVAEAFTYTAQASGTVVRLTIYLDAGNSASQASIGLYSATASGNPNRLLTQGLITSPVSGAWNTVSVPAVTLSAGQTYWIAVLGPAGGGTIQFRDAANGGKSQTSSKRSLTRLPDPWVSGHNWSNSPMSAYTSP